MKKIIKNGVCPYCNEETDYLIEDRLQHAYYQFDGENYDLEEYGDCQEDTATGFYCPICDERIFKDEEKAIKFLLKK